MHVWWAFFYEKRVILKLRIVYTNQGEKAPRKRERERAPRKTERGRSTGAHRNMC